MSWAYPNQNDGNYITRYSSNATCDSSVVSESTIVTDCIAVCDNLKRILSHVKQEHASMEIFSNKTSILKRVDVCIEATKKIACGYGRQSLVVLKQ